MAIIKAARIFGLSVLLTGCSKPMYETISIRSKNLSCSERIVFDNSAPKFGASVVRYGENVNTTVNLGADLSSGERTQEKRCNEALRIALAQQELELKLMKIKVQNEQFDAELKEFKVMKEKELLNEEYSELTSEY